MMKQQTLQEVSVVIPTNEQDGLLHLARNLNIHPDVLIGRGMGIFGAGMIGAGKTTVMARLFEQFGFCGLPFAIFDLEGDLASLVDLLPRGVLASATNCPMVKDLYGDGLQAVFDMTSWENIGDAARVMIALVDGLMTYTSMLPHHVRVPFLIGIDEIAYWVPQKRSGHEHLSPDQFKALHASLSTLVSRGRKRGLVPCFFTQRFAHVHKDVLAPGTFILMRTTLDTDLARYMEYTDASAFGEDADLSMRQVKARIAKFREGQGIVKLPTGRMGVVQFSNRESEHISHAPKTQAALNAYRNVAFDPHRHYGAFQQERVQEPRQEEKIVAMKPAVSMRPEDQVVSFGAGPQKPSVVEPRVRALLEENPNYTPAQIARRANCAYRDAEMWMDRIRGNAKKRPPRPSVVEPRVRALLEENPNYTPAQITLRANCAYRDAEKWMKRIRPDMVIPSPPPSVVEPRVRALLEENPNYTPSQIARRANCAFCDAKKWMKRIKQQSSMSECPCVISHSEN